MRRQLLASLALVAVLASPGVPADVAATDVILNAAEAGVSIDTLVQEGVKYRTEFGFPADPAIVRALLLSVDTDYTWGGPLTIAEAADMAARIDAQDRADPVQQYVESLPDVFGGLYWSHSPFDCS